MRPGSRLHLNGFSRVGFSAVNSVKSVKNRTPRTKAFLFGSLRLRVDSSTTGLLCELGRNPKQNRFATPSASIVATDSIEAGAGCFAACFPFSGNLIRRTRVCDDRVTKRNAQRTVPPHPAQSPVAFHGTLRWLVAATACKGRETEKNKGRI